ncbi:hypothetical protein D0401_09780 [Staphylococcus epidermidis]|nr:hypothetical protein [Staphylococcus epidermidis]
MSFECQCELKKTPSHLRPPTTHFILKLIIHSLTLDFIFSKFMNGSSYAFFSDIEKLPINIYIT